MSATAGMNLPPPRAGRPKECQVVCSGELLMLWLDSIPTAATLYKPVGVPLKTPLTEEEAELVREHLERRGGPAAFGEIVRRRTAAD